MNFQISKELLSASQRNVFADMVKDIVRQLKLNPNQIPVPQTTHRRTGSGLEKVCINRFIRFSLDFFPFCSSSLFWVFFLQIFHLNYINIDIVITFSPILIHFN